jgi:hypothetical protein
MTRLLGRLLCRLGAHARHDAGTVGRLAVAGCRRARCRWRAERTVMG